MTHVAYPGCYCADCVEGTPSARITGDKDRENPVEGAPSHNIQTALRSPYRPPTGKSAGPERDDPYPTEAHHSTRHVPQLPRSGRLPERLPDRAAPEPP